MRPLVLLDAAPFCFGPVSTLQAVIDELVAFDLDLRLLSSGTTAEFMAGYDPRCALLACDSEDEADLLRHRPLFEHCALFVSNTNPVSARVALKLGAPTLYVDTLFWMWDEIDPLIARSAIYVAQTFEGIEENRRRIGGAIADFHVVGPLIGRPAAVAGRGGDCLVSFGGMSSKMTIPGVTNHYAWVMTRLLLQAFERAPPFTRYVFRGGGAVMDALALEFRDSRLEFGFAPRTRHLQEIASARNLLLSPGLTGAYEALAAGTPTWLLPPQNYSQQLQAEVFLDRADPPFEGQHWRGVYPDMELPRYMPEAEAVARVSASVLRFEDDEVAQRRYVDRLTAALPLIRAPRTPPLSGQTAPAAEVAQMVRQAVRHAVEA